MSLISDAFAEYRQIRDAFDDHLEAASLLAEHDTRGILLNARGRAAGIDPRSLFYGPRARVTAYASDELIEWFRTHGRTTYARFEQQHREDRP